MRIITLVLVYLCSSILCSGCTATKIHQQSAKEDAASAKEQVTDNRMSDPAVVDLILSSTSGIWALKISFVQTGFKTLKKV